MVVLGERCQLGPSSPPLAEGLWVWVRPPLLPVATTPWDFTFLVCGNSALEGHASCTHSNAIAQLLRCTDPHWGLAAFPSTLKIGQVCPLKRKVLRS